MKSYKISRNMSNFKENVVELLSTRGIDSKDFLLDLNLNKNYLYDCDTHSTTLNNAVNIANYLKTSLDYLCGRTLNERQFKNLDASNFYKNLKKLIEQLDISQRKFCRDLKYSRNSWTRWKTSSLPNLNTIIEITDYLGCSIDDLLI